MRERRGLCRMVVARNCKNASKSGGSKHVGGTKDITRAIHAGAFAIPDAEDALVIRVPIGLVHLRPEERSGSKVLVQAWLERDVMLLELFLRLPQSLVVRPKWR